MSPDGHGHDSRGVPFRKSPLRSGGRDVRLSYWAVSFYRKQTRAPYDAGSHSDHTVWGR
jgi:hypothetical protein